MIKQRVYVLLALVQLAIFYPGVLMAEGFVLFADQNLSEVTLVATNPGEGTFQVIDRAGFVQDGALDDFIGLEGAKVIEVRNTAIVVATEEEFDLNGTVRSRSMATVIPLAQVFEGGKGGR